MVSGADVEDADVEEPVEMIVVVNVVGIYVEGVVSDVIGLVSLGDEVGASGAADVDCSGGIGVGVEVSEPEVVEASVEVELGMSVVAAVEPVVTGSNVVIGTAVVGAV